MSFYFPLYSLFFLAASILAVVLSVFVLGRRGTHRGAVPFALLMIAVSVWVLCRTCEAGATNFADKEFWGKMEYFGISNVGVLWLLFTLGYSGNRWWHKPNRLLLLFLFPIIILIAAWTPWSTLIWPRVYFSPEAPFSILVWEHGTLFWLFVVFQYSVFIIGFIVLWRFALRSSRAIRRQLLWLVIGTILPLVGNVIYLSGFAPVTGLDLTPFVFILAGLFYVVTIFSFKFMDIIPAARNKLVENMNDGTIVLDDNNAISDINPAAARILKWETAVVSGQKIENVWPSWQKIIEKKVDSGGELTLDIQENNTKKYLMVIITPLLNEDSSLAGKLVVVRDITVYVLSDKKQEELLIREQVLRQSLEDEIEKRSVFTRALVHELKTPLTALMVSSELLETEASDNLQTELLQNIRRSSTRLNQRISELTELARGETGTLTISSFSIDISKIIKEIITEMAPVAAEKNNILSAEVSGNLPAVKADSERLHQVFSNLLSNAFRYTAQGNITIRARRADADFLMVQVADTGKGIGIDKMAQLFDPYKRDRDSQSGLGIGLALSKLIIELHGGTIRADNNTPKGTIISFTLPFAKE